MITINERTYTNVGTTTNPIYRITQQLFKGRASVVFDGTATDLTASITNSYNISSITDYGVGQYGVTFSETIPDPIPIAAARTLSLPPYIVQPIFVSSSAVTIYITDRLGTFTDSVGVYLVVI